MVGSVAGWSFRCQAWILQKWGHPLDDGTHRFCRECRRVVERNLARHRSAAGMLAGGADGNDGLAFGCW